MTTKKSPKSKAQQQSATDPHEFVSSGARDDANRLSASLYAVYLRMGQLSQFHDIPESWLDGGAPQERYDRLMDMLGSKTLKSDIDNAITHIESWLKKDQKGLKGMLAAYWGKYYRLHDDQIGDIIKAADGLSVGLKAVLAELKEISKFLDLPGKKGDQNFKDMVDDLLEHPQKASPLLSSCVDMISMIVSGPWYGPRYDDDGYM